MIGVDEKRTSQLFELVDSILAVGRLIYASKGDADENWSPLDIAVMRYIDRNPGTTAGAAAEATQLISSNFSRALRGLEQKGLVRRDADEHDARRVRLYPTQRAGEHLHHLRGAWSELLDGILDQKSVDRLNSSLARIESELGARARQDQ